MTEPVESIVLDDLGALSIRGADALRFLQGQVSNDVERLAAEQCLLAGYHNPQGRVIALLQLILVGANDVLAVLPRELAPLVAGRLAKFILRAKVSVADVSQTLHIRGLVAAGGTAPARADAIALARTAREPARWLGIYPAAASAAASGDRERWRRLDVAAGQPQVYARTSEEFIAQMLNLDALEAIAFDKGCYTGQEVIARAHYRGRVKRRMQRFLTHTVPELAPGDAGRLADGRAFKVVDAVRQVEGGCEFLAVAATAVRDEAQTEVEPLIEATSLPLPYSLPE
jgi:tRNA-modifying protein YgfZ